MSTTAGVWSVRPAAAAFAAAWDPDAGFRASGLGVDCNPAPTISEAEARQRFASGFADGITGLTVRATGTLTVGGVNAMRIVVGAGVAVSDTFSRFGRVLSTEATAPPAAGSGAVAEPELDPMSEPVEQVEPLEPVGALSHGFRLSFTGITGDLGVEAGGQQQQNQHHTISYQLTTHA